MNKKDRLIQIIRIVACGGVLGVHCSGKFGITGIMGKLLSYGQYGLYIFFVLSGYLAAKWNGESEIAGDVEVIFYLVHHRGLPRSMRKTWYYVCCWMSRCRSSKAVRLP